MTSLEAGLEQLGLSLADSQTEQLLEHLAQLRKWNRAYNLVARGELAQLETRHLLDSLSIAPFIDKGPVLDVGTGAGFPGIPLAIAMPEVRFTLVDSAGKKVRFLNHVIRRLGLEHVAATHTRIENYSAGSEFSIITSRAYASLRHFAESVRHLARPDTRLLAMKGRQPAEELDDLPDWIGTPAVHHLDVPGLDAERHLVVMSRVN